MAEYERRCMVICPFEICLSFTTLWLRVADVKTFLNVCTDYGCRAPVALQLVRAMAESRPYPAAAYVKGMLALAMDGWRRRSAAEEDRVRPASESPAANEYGPLPKRGLGELGGEPIRSRKFEWSYTQLRGNEHAWSIRRLAPVWVDLNKKVDNERRCECERPLSF